MSLTQKQTDLLRLIKRSNSDGEGWRRVSNMLWPHIDGVLPSDLVESRAADEGGFIRFTIRGQAVADYI